MAQGGPKVANALARAPGNPHTFHPTKLIIRIMFGPGMDCANAKKLVNSWSVTQPWVATTKSRTSGRTVGKPPKLIDDSRARCAVSAKGAGGLLIVRSRFRYPQRQCCTASGLRERTA